ncbi:glycoside hydrolase N-terminal domain-containing protein [Lachnoclostridium sp. Marseille-P6806]|uniref:glycoside hydrolase N-terminal domain-containing protein n=1 Tax=Lachnoclostridium sp. Marseille-P6806 TaxID=2364793 RepID=UPI0010315D78|nr:glycoside hydrolase N-terminal domain-containing protein [Lachnoclostridium sp. Marseille-P6806]
MVFGGAKKDRLALNLDTLWSGSGLHKDNSEKKAALRQGTNVLIGNALAGAL